MHLLPVNAPDAIHSHASHLPCATRSHLPRAQLTCGGLQFIRRCDKVCIMDHGRVQYFGPFTPQAQTILSRYLPVPDDVAGIVHAAPAKKKVDALAPKTKAAIDPKPVTSLRMGTAFWEFMKAGRAWACILAVCTGLVSQVRSLDASVVLGIWHACLVPLH